MLVLGFFAGIAWVVVGFYSYMYWVNMLDTDTEEWYDKNVWKAFYSSLLGPIICIIGYMISESRKQK